MDGSWINVLPHRRRDATCYDVPAGQSASRRSLTVDQIVLLGAACSAVVVGVWADPDGAGTVLVSVTAVVFLGLAAWRITLAFARTGKIAADPQPSVLPRYTILAALHDEAGVVGQLIERLSRIDYPPHRLQGLLVPPRGKGRPSRHIPGSVVSNSAAYSAANWRSRKVAAPVVRGRILNGAWRQASRPVRSTANRAAASRNCCGSGSSSAS